MAADILNDLENIVPSNEGISMAVTSKIPVLRSAIKKSTPIKSTSKSLNNNDKANPFLPKTTVGTDVKEKLLKELDQAIPVKKKLISLTDSPTDDLKRKATQLFDLVSDQPLVPIDKRCKLNFIPKERSFEKPQSPRQIQKNKLIATSDSIPPISQLIEAPKASRFLVAPTLPGVRSKPNCSITPKKKSPSSKGKSDFNDVEDPASLTPTKTRKQGVKDLIQKFDQQALLDHAKDHDVAPVTVTQKILFVDTKKNIPLSVKNTIRRTTKPNKKKTSKISTLASLMWLLLTAFIFSVLLNSISEYSRSVDFDTVQHKFLKCIENPKECTTNTLQYSKDFIKDFPKNSVAYKEYVVDIVYDTFLQFQVVAEFYFFKVQEVIGDLHDDPNGVWENIKLKLKPMSKQAFIDFHYYLNMVSKFVWVLVLNLEKHVRVVAVFTQRIALEAADRVVELFLFVTNTPMEEQMISYTKAFGNVKPILKQGFIEFHHYLDIFSQSLWLVLNVIMDLVNHLFFSFRSLVSNAVVELSNTNWGELPNNLLPLFKQYFTGFHYYLNIVSRSIGFGLGSMIKAIQLILQTVESRIVYVSNELYNMVSDPSAYEPTSVLKSAFIGFHYYLNVCSQAVWWVLSTVVGLVGVIFIVFQSSMISLVNDLTQMNMETIPLDTMMIKQVFNGFHYYLNIISESIWYSMNAMNIVLMDVFNVVIKVLTKIVQGGHERITKDLEPILTFIETKVLMGTDIKLDHDVASLLLLTTIGGGVIMYVALKPLLYKNNSK
ncbi:hypothetical protein BC833DRAFT_600237 [Globomyces pollinis-pini]|nr:hypothetical protein BC833DRAFT_600237 [Globomyces pollinis-pini]